MFRRGRILLTILLILFALYVVFGFLIAPRLIRSQVLPKVQERLVPELTIERLSLNPLTLSFTARGIRLAQPDSTAPAEIEEFYINLSSWSLLRLKPVVTKIRLQSPVLNIALDSDGQVNWAQLLVPSEEAPPAPSGEARPQHFVLEELFIMGGVLSFEDASLGETFTQKIGPIDFQLEHLDTTVVESCALNLSAATPEGGSLNWTGGLQIFPLRGEGQLSFDGFAAHRISPYLARHFGLKSSSASLSWKIAYAMDFGAAEPVLRLDDGWIELKDLSLHPKDRNEPFFALKALTIAGISADIFQQSAHVSSIQLIAPELKAQRDAEGQIDLLGLLPTAPSDSPNTTASSESATSSAPWQWSVDSITLETGRLDWSDEAVVPAAHLALHLETLSLGPIFSDLSTPIPLAVNLSLEEAGSFTLKGEIAPAPVTGQIQLNMAAFNPGAVGAYWSPAVGLEWRKGSVSSQTALDMSTSVTGELQLKSTSDLQLEQIQIVEPASNLALVEGNSIRAESIVFAFPPSQISIERILLDAIHVTLLRDTEGRMNLPGSAEDVVATEEATTEEPPPSEAPPSEKAELSMHVAVVELNRSQIDFTDSSVDPVVGLRIEDFGGTIKGIDSDPAARAVIDLKGTVQGVSTLTIAGTLNPFPEHLFIDVSTHLSPTDLTLFSPYSAQALGRKIAKGKLSFDLEEKVENRRLNSSNALRLDQFEWGDKVDAPDAPSLPLDLAVTLFKDTQGVIDLNVPLSGNLDDPDFSITALALQAFGNLFTKMITSPFRFLAGQFGSGEVDPSVLAFEAGSSALDRSNPAIEVIVAMHEARPLLRFELQGHFSEVDRLALQAQSPVQLEPSTLIKLAKDRGEAAQAVLIEAGLGADTLFLLEPSDVPTEDPIVNVQIAQ